MARVVLQKDEKTLLNDLSFPTPKNIQMICEMIDNGKSLIQIWRLLNDNFKTNLEIQIAFIKQVNVHSFSSICQFLQEEGGLSPEAFYALLKEHNPSFFEDCIRLDKMPTNIKKQAIIETPEFAKHLTEKDPIKEILDRQPKIARYLSDKIPHTIDILGTNGISQTSFWEGDKGTKQYFHLANGLKLQGRDDYRKLVDAYLQENTSIFEFCSHYMIDPPKAFENVLTRFEEEDPELKEQISKVKTSVQQKYLSAMKNLIADILSGKTTIDASIQANPSINAYDFLNAKSYLDLDDYIQLMEQMGSEIGIPEFTESRREEDAYGVEFPCIGNVSIETLIQWFSQKDTDNPGHDTWVGLKEFLKTCKVNLGTAYCIPPLEKKLLSTISAFAQRINVDQLLNDLSFKLENGQFRRPTNENIQDAIEYLTARNKYICQKNMKCVLKSIVQGSLTKETILQVEKEKKSNVLPNDTRHQEKLEKASTLDEYIACVSTLRTTDNATPTDALEDFYIQVAQNSNLYSPSEVETFALQTGLANPHLSLEAQEEKDKDGGYPNL